MSEALLDSNVVRRLLAKADPKHLSVDRAVTEALRVGHRLYVAPQVLMESWVVLTRPVDVNGYGWEPSVAEDALAGVLERFTLSEETPDVFDEW